MKAKLLSATGALGLILSGLVQGASATAMPQVAEPYQQSLQKAWAQVSRGELPVYECTQLAGHAAREMPDKNAVAAARQAYKACYVDAAVRYSDAYFKLRNNAQLTEDNKPLGCTMYSRYIKGHVASLASHLDTFGFSAAELNSEITQKLDATSAQCQVDLNS